MDNNLEFPTSKMYTKDMVQRVQRRLIEMAKAALPILDANKVKYFITFGTLLGAVRHRGFIPWDDDFDIFIFDDEYDRAIEVLRASLPADIFVHDRTIDTNYYPAWARLRDVHSDCSAVKWPDDNIFKYRGINLDLYRLKKVDANRIDMYRQKEMVEFLVRKHDAGCFDNVTYLSKLNKACSLYAEMIRNPPLMANRSVYSFVLLLREYPEEELFPLKRYTFEDMEVWGPKNPDVLLRQAYGASYMECPPYEDRRPHYDIVKFI